MKQTDLDPEAARALCDAGYMPLPEYLRFCEDHDIPPTTNSGGHGGKLPDDE